RGTSELLLDTDSEGDILGEEDTNEGREDEILDADDEREGLDDERRGLGDEDLGLEGERLGFERSEEEAVLEGQNGQQSWVLSTFEVGQSSRSVLELQGAERVYVLRQPTLVVPSPIASPVATLTATISVEEDQFLEVGAHLELHRSILHDHTQRLDALPPTLFADINRDVRELYTRSGVAGHVDTRMKDMSRAGYDDHRLIHDMLVQQTTLQRKLQEMRGRVTV
ncbi:hypothetical protein Tco_1087980, partial [Tanacetum coccineum]